MSKVQKEYLLKDLKEHISMLVEFSRFDMARFYCEIASKISMNKSIGQDFIVYLNEQTVEIDKHIISYLKDNNLLK